MTERTLRVLEFNKIRAQLTQFCESDMGAALCEALEPLISEAIARKARQRRYAP